MRYVIQNWNSLLWSLLLIILMVSGAEAADTLKVEYLRHEGINRTYYVYLPEHFATLENPPLILALHGGGGRANKFSRMDRGRLLRAADEHGVVVVFPQGHKRRWNDGRAEIYEHMFRPIDPPDDVGFFRKLIETIEEEYQTDPDRVFATGISNGGFMSIRLALELSDKIRAIAPVTAQITAAMSDKESTAPVSVLIINGTEDPLVPYDGGDVTLSKDRSRGKVLSTRESMERFARFNGCETDPVDMELPDLTARDETTAIEYRYPDCRDGAEVVLIEIRGGGHTWPGGIQYFPERVVGRVSRDINASELIVDFFINQK